MRLKPGGSTGGHVDGGWWPRSRDLTAELPALAKVLAVRLGSVWRVVYALSSWETAPRRIRFDGHPVRLEGFRSQDKDIVSVVSLDRRRIRLLVIPTDAAKTAAHDAMMTAAGRDNADSPTTILVAAGIRPSTLLPTPREATDDARDRWEADGGHVDTRHDVSK
ncbi:DUF5994 family protein [Actinocrispum sp. NPDC049592]|uniref:DUF5994 family protein n=1 Tax=Actinocrispum sp. NPDC049592 TaxID=3154835 RepID=UPI003417BF27